MSMAVEREVSSTSSKPSSKESASSMGRAAMAVKAMAKRATKSVNLDEMIMMSNFPMTRCWGRPWF
jgi:hypothetical protein